MHETNGEVGFLLDTNVWSDKLRGRAPMVREWYDALGSGRRYLAWCVLQEIETGAFKAEARKSVRNGALYRAWTDSLIRTEGLVMPTAEVVIECGRLRAEPKLTNLWITRPGRAVPNSGADVDLSALARITGIPIASENIKDFKRINAVFPIPGLYVPSSRTWAIDNRT